MISRSQIAGCRGRDGLAGLLAELGFRVELEPLAAPVWAAMGVTPSLPEGTTMWRASRAGAAEIYIATGEGARAAIQGWATALTSWNSVLKTIIFYSDDKTNLISVFGADAKGRTRRIDLDPGSPRQEAIDRVSVLELKRFERPSEIPQAVERAFEKESVGRSFFVRFRESCREIAADLRSLHPEEPERAIAGESLLILSRILFLYFIQQKGWLDGNRAFLPALVQQSSDRREGTFSGVFLPLFFGCLNTPVGKRDRFARRMGRIPYLNGGLFEPSGYESRHPVVALDEGLLQRTILSTFERYQFTIEEDDEAGSHIDPEMLGHVFESLMGEEERLASGSFYTPRAVVDVLVRKALVAWFPGSRGDRARLSAWLSGEVRELEVSDPQALLRALRSLRILDPACGSGAFLLAALHQIERIELALRSTKTRSNHSTRRRIVARSLYGIDLKPEAVRLCELRLWLAIVASHRGDPMTVDPLPNLDRNILQGNTLLGPLDYLGDARYDLYREWSFALRSRESLLERYRAASPEARPRLTRALRDSDRSLATSILERSIDAVCLERDELSLPQSGLFGAPRRLHGERIAHLEQRRAELQAEKERAERGELGFFAVDVHFAHIARDGGFDLLVGNPPWVRSSRIDPATRRSLADRYPMFGAPLGRRGIHQGDLSLAFFEKSLGLVREGGAIGFLMPAKIATADYARRFRAELGSRASVWSIEDWSGRSTALFAADTFPLGLVVRRTISAAGIDVSADGDRFTLPQRELSRERGGPWILARPDVRRILDDIGRRLPSFSDRFGTPMMGVKTGSNADFFVKPEIDSKRGIARVEGIELPISALARVVRGRDLRRWRALDSLWMVCPEPDAVWLDLWSANRGSAPRELAYLRREHFMPKVVWKDLGRGMTAAALAPTRIFDSFDVRVVPNQTVYCAAVENLDKAYLAAAILNGTISGAWLVSIADRAKDSHYRYFGRSVATVPIPELTPALATTVVAAARFAGTDGEARERVERMILDAYGLDRREEAALASFLARRLGRPA